MNTAKVLKNVLAGSAAVALLALITAPQTGWIARTQLSRAFIPIGDLWDLERVPSRAPEANEYATALGSLTGPADKIVTPARALETRFPTTPAAYANPLRYAMMSSFHLHRGEQRLVESETPAPPSRPISSSPEALSAFDRDAAIGERLDPNNGYFPAMRSIGLFEMRRDNEALAAWNRAAQKPEWREYFDDEVQGRFHQWEGAKGRQSAIVRSAIFASTLFPHLGELRESARLAIYYAMQNEIHGDAARGAQIRRDIMQAGGLMRAHGQSGITALVGIGIARTALLRPGGAPPPSVTIDDNAPMSELDAYCRYLEKTCNDAMIPAVRAEYASDTIASAVLERGQRQPKNPLRAWQSVGQHWIVGWTVLVNIFWMLILGGVSLATQRLQRKPAAVKRNLILAILSASALIFIAAAQIRVLTRSGDVLSAITDAPLQQPALLLDMELFALPIIIAAACLAMALIKQKPAAPALAHGFRQAAIPAATLGVLLYAALILSTARMEVIENRSLDRLLENTGSYFAEITHENWPGMTPWPKSES